ncbi:hypothetical protein MAM1_0055c03553 [Mucor ambiguus]|uniref:Uncharacterized protein n=1 Tax=Mucor ambiguus TaxID=91626 RepID=A0A0C9M9S7_9FUNG|nr:hypothetical protein MAM1_0055c03553 [Mucor ambiguus]
MEQRIQQFHDDTKAIPKPPTAKTVKQMNTLKKFIFKNQKVRSDWRYLVNLTSNVHASGLTDKVSSFPLIEDSLKVPCFTTKQKSQLLKWYDEILAKEGGEGQDVAKAADKNDDDDEPNYDDFDWDAFEKEQDV